MGHLLMQRQIRTRAGELAQQKYRGEDRGPPFLTELDDGARRQEQRRGVLAAVGE